MQAIPVVRIRHNDLPPEIPAMDPAMIDYMQWKGRRIEVLGTTDDSRLVTELDDEDE